MNNISKVFDYEKNKNILNQCKISYNEDNSKILNGSNETNVKIYYSQKGEKIHDLKEHNLEITSCIFRHKNNNYIIATSMDKKCKFGI